MSTKKYGHRGGATPDYNIVLLGQIGVGKSGRFIIVFYFKQIVSKTYWIA